jgi:hypothetical protein
MNTLNANEGNIKKIVAKIRELVSYVTTESLTVVGLVEDMETAQGDIIDAEEAIATLEDTTIPAIEADVAAIQEVKLLTIDPADFVDTEGNYIATITIAEVVATDTIAEVFSVYGYTLTAGTGNILINAGASQPTIAVVIGVSITHAA